MVLCVRNVHHVDLQPESPLHKLSVVNISLSFSLSLKGIKREVKGRGVKKIQRKLTRVKIWIMSFPVLFMTIHCTNVRSSEIDGS